MLQKILTKREEDSTLKSSLGLGWFLLPLEENQLSKLPSSEDSNSTKVNQAIDKLLPWLKKKKMVSENDRHSSVYKLKNYAIH